MRSGGTRMEWATIGLLDTGDDGKMQWNTRGTVMQEAQGKHTCIILYKHKPDQLVTKSNRW